MPEWYVSQVDVEKHPKFGKAHLEEILYDYGLDVSKGYIEDGRWLLESHNLEEYDEYDYYHRALCGERVKCPRYYGLARTDGKWKSFVNRFLDLPVEFTRGKGKGK